MMSANLLLPEGYEPCRDCVIMGRGKHIHDHPGNKHLQEILQVSSSKVNSVRVFQNGRYILVVAKIPRSDPFVHPLIPAISLLSHSCCGYPTLVSTTTTHTTQRELEAYSSSGRVEKTNIIIKVVEEIRANSAGGYGFVKKDPAKGRWFMLENIPGT